MVNGLHAINSDPNGEVAVLGANVLLGCLKGGVGAISRERGFFRGCAEGIAGGAVAFAGEKIASYTNYSCAGGAGKLLHDLGNSMSDNIMRGESQLSQFQTDLGPLNLTFRHSLVPKVTFTLTPLYGIYWALSQGNHFDIQNSVYNLTPIFKKDRPERISPNHPSVSFGETVGNIIEYQPHRGTVSHEMNHALLWRKLHFTADIFHPFSNIPILKWWDVGQDLANLSFSMPYYLSDNWYAYDPVELEAYTMMQRD